MLPKQRWNITCFDCDNVIPCLHPYLWHVLRTPVLEWHRADSSLLQDKEIPEASDLLLYDFQMKVK